MNKIYNFLFRNLYKLSIPYKVNSLSKKDVIEVLFILNDLSKWKSEELYLEMKKHPNFNPVLGVTYRKGESVSAFSNKVIQLIRYLNKKKYHYIELKNTISPNPDIVIYTEPYESAVPFKQSAFAYRKSLFLNIAYSCHTTHLDIDYFTQIQEIAWIDCYESKLALQDAYKYIGNHRKSLSLTGLPMFDILLKPIKNDPWKKQNNKKKRLIWAPHHSLGGFAGETIIYSNFLDICDYMLDIADEYYDEIQIAFKPHPLLREKLEKIWGYKKTEEYYNKWQNLKNGQLETGEYTDLFKCSDAMIHDSSSFIVEYQLMNKPILFITRDENSICKDLNNYGMRFFKAQRLTSNQNGIKNFINDVINGIDTKRAEREELLSGDIVGLEGDKSSTRIVQLILNKTQNHD